MNAVPRRRAAIKTLGCKLNQFEGEQIREQLQRRGYEVVPFDSPADLYVINSCTVTSRGDRDCRRLARQAKRLSPASMVVVTGCYAEVSPERLRQLEQVDLVIDNAEKPRLAELVPPGGTACGEKLADEANELIDEFTGHTRAFLKAQEGCEAGCTYCIVPLARGASRCVPAEQVIAQAERLIAAGHPELVLIGTHLGKYEEGGADLAGLCERLCELEGLGRLRLSSIEPLEVTERLIDLVAAGGHALTPAEEMPGRGKLCRHLHLPLQSGSDSVLRRMNRPYEAAYYVDLVRRIKQREPRLCLGADVMVGFPGETEEEFEQTRALLEELPLSYLHVFTYSLRAGTPAAELPGQLQGQVKQARNQTLRELSERKRQQFGEELVGEVLEVVVERVAPEVRGISDNYMQVCFEGGEELKGRIVAVRVTGCVEGVLRGASVGGSGPLESL